jgi:uroporphyrinogen III methyltransferase/synthase
MNNTGKTITAAVALALLAATAWYGLDQGGRQASLLQQGHLQSGVSADAALQSAKENEIWLSEITLSVGLISEALTATGNVAVAVALLDAMDRRLGVQAVSPAVAAIRAAVAADRQQLMAVRHLDLAAAASSLDRAMQATETLRLVSSPGLDRNNPPTALPTQAAQTTWQEILSALQSRLTEVVRIRRVEHPDAVFLTPEQGVFVRERLRLRFLSAKLALLSRQEAVLVQDLVAAERILQQAFDQTDPGVTDQLKVVAELRKVAMQFAPLTLKELPKVLATLQAPRQTP